MCESEVYAIIKYHIKLKDTKQDNKIRYNHKHTKFIIVQC